MVVFFQSAEQTQKLQSVQKNLTELKSTIHEN